MSTATSQAELLLMASIARRHYLRGESKIEIGEHFGLSRFKVARLLDAAHDSGLVRIEIAPAEGLNLDLSARVKEEFGLSHCAVLAPGATTPDEINQALGRVAAGLLAETLTDKDVVGLPWSRSVLAMSEHVSGWPAVKIVQLSGGMEVAGYDASAVELIRSVARSCNGESVIFHAPFLLDDAEGAEAMRRQSSVGSALEAVGEVTHAVVGVGQWASGFSTIYEIAGDSSLAEAAESGVVGESAGVFYDSAGAPVELEITTRMISITADQLRAIPNVWALAAGATKAQAMAAAIQGQFVNSLVIDEGLANALVD